MTTAISTISSKGGGPTLVRSPYLLKTWTFEVFAQTWPEYVVGKSKTTATTRSSLPTGHHAFFSVEIRETERRERRSHHIDAVSAARRRPLAAVGEAAVIGGGAVHVRRLQLHLAGCDGGVELYLRPVHDVEHQADADDDLQGTEEEVTVHTGGIA